MGNLIGRDPDVALAEDFASIDRPVFIAPLCELDPTVGSWDIVDTADKRKSCRMVRA